MVGVRSKSIVSLILKMAFSLLIDGSFAFTPIINSDNFSRLVVSHIQSREGQRVNDLSYGFGGKGEIRFGEILKARNFRRELQILPQFTHGKMMSSQWWPWVWIKALHVPSIQIKSLHESQQTREFKRWLSTHWAHRPDARCDSPPLGAMATLNTLNLKRRVDHFSLAIRQS